MIWIITYIDKNDEFGEHVHVEGGWEHTHKRYEGMKFKCIVINGKFCSQTTTGVQRYAHEIVAAMDKIAEPDIEIILAVNKEAKYLPELQNIKIMNIGKLGGVLWEQISLPFFLFKRNALCVNLCNMAPILTPHIVAIHDVSYKVNKQFFSKKFSLWYNFVFDLIIGRIKEIFTVSQFSKSEICRTYKKDFENITVTYNGWQHMEKISECDTALEKYGLQKNRFFFAMSSLAPNKNFRWIALAARNNPEYAFAVSGAVNKKVFGDVFDFEIPKNLIFLGYVSDKEAKSLMKNCRAFLFPTFYEGFGIPPLEALSLGAKAVVSDASCMREIFGGSVYYIDPNEASVDLDKLLTTHAENPEIMLKKYDWTNSARIIYKIIKSKIYGSLL